jgi:paraquat-inducible protein A
MVAEAISIRIACPECDLPVVVVQPGDRKRALCPRCRHVLAAGSSIGLQRSVAYAACGLVFLFVANLFPFLSFSRAGLGNEMTLLQSAAALIDGGSPVLGFLVLAFIILVPAIILVLILLLLVPILLNRAVPWLVPSGRLIFTLYPWSMSEVFIIGVIASLVKIAGMATVEIGVSFWAYGVFAIFFALAVASLDRFTVWTAVERLSR